MFEGQVDSDKRLNKPYDDVERHYHVITKITGAVARKYVFKWCNKGYGSDVTHVCDQTFSDCLASPPCAFSDFESPATTAIGILEIARFSTSTRKSPQRKVCM